MSIRSRIMHACFLGCLLDSTPHVYLLLEHSRIRNVLAPWTAATIYAKLPQYAWLLPGCMLDSMPHVYLVLEQSQI